MEFNILEVRWQGSLWPNLKYYLGIYLQGLRKAAKLLIQDNHYTGRNLNANLRIQAGKPLTVSQRLVHDIVKKTGSVRKT